jgi:hypothetical protein
MTPIRDTGRCQHCRRVLWLDPDSGRIPAHDLKPRQPTWLTGGRAHKRRCPGAGQPPRPEVGR